MSVVVPLSQQQQQPLFDIQSLPRKEDTQTPPPAYSTAVPARRIHYYPQGSGQRVVLNRPALATLTCTMSEHEGATSPISLRINTSIRIGSDNNIVCLTDTPAEHANAVARAVVHAIRENSSGQCGIPMIDEDGRPRPITIAVDAGLTVEGAGNVFGGETIVGEALKQRAQRGLRRPRDDEDTCESPAKRTREE